MPLKSKAVGSMRMDAISGAILSSVTVLSSDVDAVFRFPATSSTLSAGIDGCSVPSVPADIASTLKTVLPLTWVTCQNTNCAVPSCTMSACVNVAGLIGSENVAVNSTGSVFVGSTCPTACSIVSDGFFVSISNSCTGW